MGAGRKLGEGLNTQNQEVGLNPHEMDLSPFLSLSLSLPSLFHPFSLSLPVYLSQKALSSILLKSHLGSSPQLVVKIFTRNS